MATAKIGVGWFLCPAFAMVLACSSAHSGGGTGGSAGFDAGAGTGGTTSDARYACGDASCSVAQEYCRDLGSRGGATGNGDGGDPINSNHYFFCVPFGDCAAHDCSCVPENYANFFCFCSQPDGGGVLASCGQI